MNVKNAHTHTRWRQWNEHKMETERGGNGDGGGDPRTTRGGNGSGDGNENSGGNGNGDGVEDRIGEGRGEGKKRKKPHKNFRRDVGNGRDLGVKRKKRRRESIGSVAADPDNLENRKEQGGKHKAFRA